MEGEYPASEIFSSPPRSMNAMGWGAQEQTFTSQCERVWVDVWTDKPRVLRWTLNHGLLTHTSWVFVPLPTTWRKTHLSSSRTWRSVRSKQGRTDTVISCSQYLACPQLQFNTRTTWDRKCLPRVASKFSHPSQTRGSPASPLPLTWYTVAVQSSA